MVIKRRRKKVPRICISIALVIFFSGTLSAEELREVGTEEELVVAAEEGGRILLGPMFSEIKILHSLVPTEDLMIEGNGQTVRPEASSRMRQPFMMLGLEEGQTHLQNMTISGFVSGGVQISAGGVASFADVEFISNEVKSSGGAINNEGLISTIRSVRFEGNHTAETGGRYEMSGGAIENSGEIVEIEESEFVSNYSYDRGGALYNGGEIGQIINSSFKDNRTLKSGSQGGAIYSASNLKITADNGTSEFTGNYVLADGVKTPNAIYISSNSSTLTLNSINDGQIIFDDEIDGNEGYKIALTGDERGTIDFNNNIRNANITHENVTTNLSDVAYLNNNNSLTVNSGKFNITQFGVDDVLTANAITVNGGVLNIAQADVDLQAENKMGTIDGNKLTVNGGSINIDQMLISQDGNEGETRAQFITGTNIPQVDISVVETVAPIYKYSVTYDAARGEFVFMRGDKIVPDPIPSTPIRPITPRYKAFNPGVFSGDVLAMSGLNTQNAAVKQFFDFGDVREVDTSRGRVWATPFYSDDTIEYKNFYDIDSTNYGLVAGVDSKTYGDQWKHVYTVFGAYNDGANKYQGVKVDTESWMLGLKASVYKQRINDMFYGDALINYAWHDGKAKTAFGKDNIDTTGYGAAIKAGYKHRFEKVELDTSAMLNWQNIQSNDFKSKSGVKISTDDYSRLSLTPQVKIGYNAEPIRPYVLMRYNFILDEDGLSVLNHQLDIPSFDSKGYVEYGLGLETITIIQHNAYTHILRHDSTRSGWSATAGYRYNF